MDRDSLILDCLPRIEKLVDRFLRGRPSAAGLRDDMVSETVLQVTVALNDFAKNSTRINQLLSPITRWACFRVIQQSSPTATPREAYLPRQRRRAPLDDAVIARNDQQLTEAEIDDWIDRHSRDYLDWATIQLSREGYSIPQIAQRLRVSYPTV